MLHVLQSFQQFLSVRQSLHSYRKSGFYKGSIRSHYRYSRKIIFARIRAMNLIVGSFKEDHMQLICSIFFLITANECG